MSDINIVRWARDERHLPSDEVNRCFEEERRRLQVFAFETRRLRVDRHAGNFSLKFVTRGRENYHIDRAVVGLDPGKMLLVNEGETYESSIPDLTTAAVSCFLPEALSRDEPEIVPVPFRASALLQQLMADLVHHLSAPLSLNACVVREVVTEMTTIAVTDNLAVFRPGMLPAVERRETRRDLVARVVRARDLIEDRHGVRVTLDELAREACLSKFHFLRVFADVFGSTPLSYANRVLLRWAHAVREQGVPVKRIAQVTGYSSPSALQRALRRVT